MHRDSSEPVLRPYLVPHAAEPAPSASRITLTPVFAPPSPRPGAAGGVTSPASGHPLAIAVAAAVNDARTLPPALRIEGLAAVRFVDVRAGLPRESVLDRARATLTFHHDTLEGVVRARSADEARRALRLFVLRDLARHLGDAPASLALACGVGRDHGDAALEFELLADAAARERAEWLESEVLPAGATARLRQDMLRLDLDLARRPADAPPASRLERTRAVRRFVGKVAERLLLGHDRLPRGEGRRAVLAASWPEDGGPLTVRDLRANRALVWTADLDAESLAALEDAALAGDAAGVTAALLPYLETRRAGRVSV